MARTGRGGQSPFFILLRGIQRSALLPLGVTAFLLLAVGAAVATVRRKVEDVVDLLLDARDTARVAAADDVDEAFRARELLLLDDFAVLDHVDRDVRVEVAEHLQIEVDHAFYLNDILMTVFVRARVPDNRDAAVEPVELCQLVDAHSGSRLDVVDHESILDTVNI